MNNRLIGNGKFVLIAVAMIGGSVLAGYNAPPIDYKFDTFNFSIENFTVPKIDLPNTVSPFEKPTVDRNDPPQFKTFAEELSWYSQLKENCDGCDREKVKSITNCDILVRDYKQNPDNPLKPTLALHILEVCEI